MAWEDNAIAGFTGQYPAGVKYVVAVIGAVFVVGLGRILMHRTLKRAAVEQVENLEEGVHGHGAKPGPATNHTAR
jgi:hypothetical protein